jgi:RNA polymerase sigma-70 factor, ECF subfamily
MDAERDLARAATRIAGNGSARDELVTEGGRSDAALVHAAREGSEPAVAALFRRHWRYAYQAAYLVCQDRSAAEDIAQEAFVAAVRSLHRFDRRRPFAPWLHRIVVNRAIDWTRTRNARRESQLDGAPELGEDPGSSPDEHQELRAALAGLSPEHRAVIVLRYLLDLSPGEIARTLDLPRGTVNSRLRRGLDQLGLNLERERVR